MKTVYADLISPIKVVVSDEIERSVEEAREEVDKLKISHEEWKPRIDIPVPIVAEADTVPDYDGLVRTHGAVVIRVGIHGDDDESGYVKAEIGEYDVDGKFSGITDGKDIADLPDVHFEWRFVNAIIDADNKENPHRIVETDHVPRLAEAVLVQLPEKIHNTTEMGALAGERSSVSAAASISEVNYYKRLGGICEGILQGQQPLEGLISLRTQRSKLDFSARADEGYRLEMNTDVRPRRERL